MKVLTYRLCLEQPLLATSLEGDPNSSRSFDFIPGSQVRGLLIRRYREGSGVVGDNLAADPIALRRFFSGTTRYLHAYPLLADESRSLPTPLALRRPKGVSGRSGYTALNLSITEGRELLAEAGPAAQFQPLGDPFCVEAGRDGLRSLRPEHAVAIHIQRDRGFGRARRDSGEVFRYDALAAGQWFAGAILCDDDADAAALKALLDQEPTAWLGRSRSAQYGRVQFAQTAVEGPEWREARHSFSGTHESLTMTLLSDMLLRDALGREVVTPDEGTLSAALGFQVGVLSELSVTAVSLAGSYNTTARMPGVQRHALRAGSVIALRPTDSLAADRLAERRAAIEWAGLGERRAEGYGRVVFNWLAEPELLVSRAVPYRQAAVVAPRLSNAGERLAQLMARRLLAGEIDERIARFARDEVAERAGVVASMPSTSQLGRVRVLIRRALPSGDVAAVRAALAAMEQAAAEQFERARVAGQPLRRWLAALLADPADGQAPVWSVLNLDPSARRVGGTPPPNDALLARVSALRLAEAVLATAARQRRRESSQ
jgi:CRISPR-associated protein Csx10